MFQEEEDSEEYLKGWGPVYKGIDGIYEYLMMIPWSWISSKMECIRDCILYIKYGHSIDQTFNQLTKLLLSLTFYQVSIEHLRRLWHANGGLSLLRTLGPVLFLDVIFRTLHSSIGPFSLSGISRWVDLNTQLAGADSAGGHRGTCPPPPGSDSKHGYIHTIL